MIESLSNLHLYFKVNLDWLRLGKTWDSGREKNIGVDGIKPSQSLLINDEIEAIKD